MEEGNQIVTITYNGKTAVFDIPMEQMLETFFLVVSKVKKWYNEIGRILLSCNYARCDIYGT